VGARVTAQEQRLDAEQEQLRQQLLFRAQTADQAWGFLRDNFERLWGKIHSASPAAERVQGQASPSLHVRLGTAMMDFRPINILPNSFARSGWEVLQGFYVQVYQCKPEYAWSGNLWFMRSPQTESFRWFEVSYFDISGGRSKPPPFGTRDQNDYKNADLAASKIIGPWQLAFGPRAIDDEDEASFHDRWIGLFARAADGTLRPPRELPLRAGPPF